MSSEPLQITVRYDPIRLSGVLECSSETDSTAWARIREDIIRKQVETSTETERFFDFRNYESQLKRVRLPQDVLAYRMENFRTFTEQQTYLAREKKPQGFFAGGQENESVQQVQHDILAQLARKGEGDSVVPVIDVLRTAGQREPLLITNRGVVVNGNRRLAARVQHIVLLVRERENQTLDEANRKLTGVVRFLDVVRLYVWDFPNIGRIFAEGIPRELTTLRALEMLLLRIFGRNPHRIEIEGIIVALSEPQNRFVAS